MDDDDRAALDAVRDALRAERLALARHPERLWQQLADRLDPDGPAGAILQATAEARARAVGAPRPWLARCTARPDAVAPRHHLPAVTDAYHLWFSPDSSLLAIGTSRSHLLVLELSTGRLVRDTETGQARIEGLAWLDDDLVATAGYDGSVRVGRARTGEELERIDLSDVGVRTLDADARSKRLVIATERSGVVTLDLAAGTASTEPEEAEGSDEDRGTRWIRNLSVVPGGEAFVHEHEPVLDVRGTVAFEHRRSLSAPVTTTAAALEPDGVYLATGLSSGDLLLQGAARLTPWRGEVRGTYLRRGVLEEHEVHRGGMLHWPYAHRAHDGPITAVAVARPGPGHRQGVVVSGGQAGEVALTDPIAASSQVWAGVHDGAVAGVAVRPDGSVASTGRDHRLVVTPADGPDGRVAWGTLGGDGTALATDGGGRVLTGDATGEVRCWTGPGDAVLVGRLEGPVASVASAGAAVVATGPGGTVAWRAPTDGDAWVEAWRDDAAGARVVAAPGGRVLVGGISVRLATAASPPGESMVEVPHLLDLALTEDGSIAILHARADDGTTSQLVLDLADEPQGFEPGGISASPLRDPRVDPDGSVVVARRRADLVAIDLESGTAETIAATDTYRATRGLWGSTSLDACAVGPGGRIVAGSRGGRLEVHDRQDSGSPRTRVLDGGGGGALDISADGRWLAAAESGVGGGDGVQVHALDAPWPEPPAKHHDLVTKLLIMGSGDDAELFSLSRDRTVGCWHPASGERRAVLRGHGDTVVDLCLLPVGGALLTGSADRSAELWDLDGATTPRTFPARGTVLAVGVDQAAEEALVVDEACLRRWRLADGELVGEYDLPPWVRWAALADRPADSPLVLGGDDRVAAFDRHELSGPPPLELAHTVHAVHPVFGTIAVAGGGLVHRVDEHLGGRIGGLPSSVATVEAPAAAPIRCVAAGGFGGLVAWGDQAGGVWCGDTETGQVTELGHHDDDVRACLLAPDNSMVVSIAGPEIGVWPLRGARPTAMVLEGTLTALALDPGRHRMAVGDADGRVAVLDLWGVT